MFFFYVCVCFHAYLFIHQTLTFPQYAYTGTRMFGVFFYVCVCICTCVFMHIHLFIKRLPQYTVVSLMSVVIGILYTVNRLVRWG